MENSKTGGDSNQDKVVGDNGDMQQALQPKGKKEDTQQPPSSNQDKVGDKGNTQQPMQPNGNEDTPPNKPVPAR